MYSQKKDWAGGELLRGFFLILKLFVFFPESFDSACGVDQFLFAGKKRVAFGTNFNTDIGFGRANLDFAATCTTDGRVGIFRMDVFFHDTLNPPQKNFKK